MFDNKFTKEDLLRLQSLPLNEKFQISIARIMEWYNRNDKQCYVSFSGGKDSTVLAWLTAHVCSLFECKLILWFSDTGLEFPELKKHVKEFKIFLQDMFDIEVECIIDYPKDKDGSRISFRDVIEVYGYPLISKHIAQCIYEYNTSEKMRGYREKYFNPDSDYVKKYGKAYCLDKWIFLRDSNIPISHKCCEVMKKKPAHEFEKKTGLRPIVGTMACESRARKNVWLKHGCNAFDSKRPVSQPISFWTEQDILECIEKNGLPYASVYGEIKCENGKYCTTGQNRTGCMFCMFGIHLQKEPNNFQRMKQTHPKIWEYCMKPWELGGAWYERCV